MCWAHLAAQPAPHVSEWETFFRNILHNTHFQVHLAAWVQFLSFSFLPRDAAKR